MIGSPLTRAVEAPGRGYHWGMASFHSSLPRGVRVASGVLGTLREILLGPAPVNDGTMNLFGALQFSMATCGYASIKELEGRDRHRPRHHQRGEAPAAPAG